jgi:hypothetical protein
MSEFYLPDDVREQAIDAMARRIAPRSWAPDRSVGGSPAVLDAERYASIETAERALADLEAVLRETGKRIESDWRPIEEAEVTVGTRLLVAPGRDRFSPFEAAEWKATGGWRSLSDNVQLRPRHWRPMLAPPPAA